jgi:hypothetical protein
MRTALAAARDIPESVNGADIVMLLLGPADADATLVDV